MSLTLSRVSLRYPGHDEDTLSDISFTVEPGSSMAVMGASGRGKSTLLNIAGLLLAPSSGDVLIDGVARHPRDAHLLGSTIAWILQSANLLPHRSVIDNVTLPSRLAGHSTAAAFEEADALLSALGVSQRHQKAKTLSGGEAQRVGIARALLMHPSVLIADEPTANLDRHAAATVIDALVHASTTAAVVVATHDRTVASAMTSTLDLQEEVSREPATRPDLTNGHQRP